MLHVTCTRGVRSVLPVMQVSLRGSLREPGARLPQTAAVPVIVDVARALYTPIDFTKTCRVSPANPQLCICRRDAALHGCCAIVPA